MTHTYRAGVIGRTGQGDYGHALDEAFAGLSNVQLVALADPDAAGRAAAMQRTDAERGYENYQEMLEKERLDLVSVAPRWVDCHADMVIACAEAKVKGIFCEKPLARTLAEADTMLTACERNGVRLAVAHRRANAYEQYAKKLVDEGVIGEVQTMRGQGKGDHRVGGQDLIVLGTHILDSMRYFAGADVAWAHGHVTQDGREVTVADAREGDEGVGLLAGDSLSAYYVFKNGITAHFESRRGYPSGKHTSSSWFGFDVYGTKGILSLKNSPAGEAYLYRHGILLPDGGDCQWERLTVDEWEVGPDGQAYTGGDQMRLSNRMIVTELIEAIEADREVVAASSGYDARAALEMIMAVHESQRLQTRISFPLTNRENPYKVAK